MRTERGGVALVCVEGGPWSLSSQRRQAEAKLKPEEIYHTDPTHAYLVYHKHKHKPHYSRRPDRLLHVPDVPHLLLDDLLGDGLADVPDDLERRVHAAQLDVALQTIERDDANEGVFLTGVTTVVVTRKRWQQAV